ncbi:MAG: DUF898 family protein [Candidatus Paracaedibacteraceae bacterium]|nr:DUF898 family protein [Candidatus Paracaedibacteraceae bacterium]
MEKTTPIKYDGTVSHLYWLVIKMFLLNIVTLGLYTFWGYSKIRAYLTRSVLINESRYCYHGTGLDMLIGFMKILFGLMAVILIQGVILKVGLHFLGWSSDGYIITSLVMDYIIIVSFLSYVLWRTSSYQMSQTSWRGVRYRLSGKAWDFTKLVIKTLILNIITLGFLSHKTMAALYAYIFNHLHFGNQAYRLKVKDNPLLWSNVISIILFIPTLGLSRVWYIAKFRQYLYGNLEFMDLKFKNTITFGPLARLYITNILIFILTLGLGLPWIIHRTIKNYMESIEIIGNMEKARFIQMETL